MENTPSRLMSGILLEKLTGLALGKQTKQTECCGNMVTNPNNPGNVKGGGAWHGLIGHDSQGHNLYDTRLNGGRAMVRCIEQAVLAGRNTLEKLVKGWTTVEADWDDYIDYLLLNTHAAYSGNLKSLLAHDFTLWVLLLRAMVNFEKGGLYGDSIPTSEYLTWLSIWSHDFHHN